MSGQIFISYRREESRWSARSVHDRLCRDFDPKQIFMDIDAIALGEDFVKAIETTVAKCDVLIAVIGNNWLTSKDDHGDRRLDNPEDFVRMEIGAALKRGISVIPVLVDAALMPRAIDLPEDLKSLVRRNALRITDTSFDGDCQRLAAAIRLVLEKAAAVEQKRPVAPSTAPVQPQADKPSAETPKVVHPVPPKTAESKHEKPQPPTSGATPGKSPSKQVIAFLAIPAVLVIAGLIYLATRVSQSPPPQPSSVVAVTPIPPVIATPTAEEKASSTPEVAVRPTTQPTASVAMAIPSPRSVPKSWNLVGTWRANVVEQGVPMEITLHLRPDGTSTYYFRSQLGQTQVDGTWRYSNNVLYEEFGNGGQGQGALDWITENQFELTIIDNGIPAYSGLKRIYHRL
jgi:hypothetical protein